MLRVVICEWIKALEHGDKLHPCSQGQDEGVGIERAQLGVGEGKFKFYVGIKEEEKYWCNRKSKSKHR